MTITLDPENHFEAVIAKMVEVHRSKNADYAGNSWPNQNFYDVAYQTEQSAGHSVESLIAVKQARLRVLLPKFWSKRGKPNNEGIVDTLLDRAVYSVISVVLWEEGGYEPRELICSWPSE